VLSRFDQPRIADVVLAAYPQMSAALKAKARELLFSRKPWARAFIAGIERGTFDAKEVTVDELRRIALHTDEELDALVRKHWGGVRAGTPDEKLAEMRRLSNDLRAAAGDVASGHELFKKHCATCHRLHNDGNQVGPDLTHANRADREFLLASLVDPSAQVRKEFLSYVVVTTDGRVLTGLIAEQTPAEVTLLDAKNQRLRIPQSDVESLEESEASLMPENILKPLSPQELRDLFAYLQR
jgi:putative heme-binding domain-containing protein